MKVLIPIIAILAIANASPVIIQAEPEPKLVDIDYRLNDDDTRDFLPISYDIEIHPFFDVVPEGKTPFTFDAVATIKFQVLTAGRNSFKLNSYKLNIDDTKTNLTKGGAEVEGQIGRAVYIEEATQVITISFENNLVVADDYELTFVYTGLISEDMAGFYQSFYYEGATKVYLGTTQMQTASARRVFPSFDEPEFKAIFNIRIAAPKEYSVISNADLDVKESVQIEGEAEERELFVFKPTPKMSSYLVAFIVSKFVATVDAVSDGRLKVWSRPDQRTQAIYAAQVGPKLLDAIGNYLNFDYYSVEGVEKMDMAAIPDFSAGAMENWGLLTYREASQLYDVGETALITKQRIAAVIAHEQAHMWFGDLVTCKWWSYTWLNEGFARFFQYLGTDMVETEWDLAKQFVVEQVQTAMVLDSTTGTHPMSDETVNTPSQASNMFGNISYNKGASVLRMILHVMGHDNFKLALHNYLTEMQLKPSTPADLFRHFQAIVNTNLPSLTADMKPWTDLKGYPLVTVTVSADRKTASVSQQRFWQNPEDADEEKPIWSIPLTYATTTEGFADDTTKAWLRTERSTTDIAINADSWVVFNVNQIGFYRVNYDDASWKLIKGVLMGTEDKHVTEEIFDVNRAQIVDDLLQFARSGLVTYDFAFDITSYLAHEHSYFPWLSAFNSFTYLTSRMDTASLNKFKTYMKDIIEHVYEMVGFERDVTESQTTTYLRSLILSWACKVGHANCIQTARAHFDKFKATPSVPVEVNIRSSVYCSAMREGDLTDFEKLWAKYLTEQVSSEQVVILNAIGCARDKDVLVAVIEKILTDDVRPQDRRSALTATYTSTEENLGTVYEYAKGNYPRIEAGFGNSKQDVISTFSSIAGRFTTQAQINDLKAFVAEDAAYFGTSLDGAIAGAEKNLKWINANIPQINTFIDGYFDSSAATNAVSVLLLAVAGAFTYLMY